MPLPSEWLSPKECGRRLGLHTSTIYHWISIGWIKPNMMRTLPNGRHMIDLIALIELNKYKPKKTKRGTNVTSANRIVGGVIVNRRKRTEGNVGADYTEVLSDEDRALELSELFGLPMEGLSSEASSSREETMGGDTEQLGRSGGTVTKALESSPQGQAHTAYRGGSDIDSSGESSIEADKQWGMGEGRDIIPSEDERRIRLVIPSDGIYGSDTDDELSGDGDSFS